MNRTKVISECVSFRDYRKMKNGIPQITKKKVAEIKDIQDDLSIESIVKFSKDKENIKSDRKRKLLTREMLIDYLDSKYNIDYDF